MTRQNITIVSRWNVFAMSCRMYGRNQWICPGASRECGLDLLTGGESEGIRN